MYEHFYYANKTDEEIEEMILRLTPNQKEQFEKKLKECYERRHALLYARSFSMEEKVPKE